MIFYFTGTDNGKYLAKLYSHLLDDNEVVDIRPKIKYGEKSLYHSEKPYVFITPIHSWRVPKVIEKFIDDNTFAGHRDIYFLFNCGGTSGNAQDYLKEFMAKRSKLKYMGNVDIVMPDSYIILFNTASMEKRRELFEKANEQAFEISEKIKNGDRLEGRKTKWIDHIYSGPINHCFNNYMDKHKGFHVSEKCISCGKCETNCPVKAVVYVKNKPTWNDKCMQCLSCISRCPVQAIGYKKVLEKRTPYLNTFKLDDFTEQLNALTEKYNK